MDHRDDYIEAVEEIGILRDDLEEMTARAEAAEAERDALAAELAAMRGEAAPDGWSEPDWDAGSWWRSFGDDQGSPYIHVYSADDYVRWHVPVWGWRYFACGFDSEPAQSGTCDRLTGPDGAFAAAEAAAGIR